LPSVVPSVDAAAAPAIAARPSGIASSAARQADTATSDGAIGEGRWQSGMIMRL